MTRCTIHKHAPSVRRSDALLTAYMVLAFVWPPGLPTRVTEIDATEQALAGFTREQQAAWLKFVTACSRAPLLGFAFLEPRLCVQVC